MQFMEARMRVKWACVVVCAIVVAGWPRVFAQQGAAPTGGPNGASETVQALVGRLDLERYKATIKGLTQFGDRRQGTDRNRAAVDWIEAQLKSYGCANTSRLKYTFFPSEPPHPSGPSVGAGRSVGGARYRGVKAPTGVNVDPKLQPDEKLRALNSQPSEGGAREEVFCTKIGSTHPEEMYIVGAHMD